jgi:hypothetical protein
MESDMKFVYRERRATLTEHIAALPEYNHVPDAAYTSYADSVVASVKHYIEVAKEKFHLHAADHKNKYETKPLQRRLPHFPQCPCRP